MDDSIQLERLAGVTAVLAGVCFIASGVLQAAALNFNLSLAAFSGDMISIGSRGADLLRRGLYLDGLGSRLLVAPLAIYLWHWLKPGRTNLVGLYTLCGLAYMLVGAIGVFVLTATLPPLIDAYAQAAAQQRETL